MFTISISCTTMNSTSKEPDRNPTINSELYMLIIVIKLSIFMAFKIGRSLVQIYSCHKKSIIDKHNRITIAKLQRMTAKANDNLEAGMST